MRIHVISTRQSIWQRHRVGPFYSAAADTPFPCARSKPTPSPRCVTPPLQAAKIIANLLVAGGTVLFRAASQAYRQAIISERLPLCSCYSTCCRCCCCCYLVPTQPAAAAV